MPKWLAPDRILHMTIVLAAVELVALAIEWWLQAPGKLPQIVGGPFGEDFSNYWGGSAASERALRLLAYVPGRSCGWRAATGLRGLLFSRPPADSAACRLCHASYLLQHGVRTERSVHRCAFGQSSDVLDQRPNPVWSAVWAHLL